MGSSVRIDPETGEVFHEEDRSPIVLAEELIYHLSDPLSAERLYKERFTADYLTDEETEARQVLDYQIANIHQYGSPAPRSALEYRFENIEFMEPDSDVNWLIDQFKVRYLRNQGQAIIIAIAPKLFSDPKGTIEQAARDFSLIRERIRPQDTVLQTRDYEHTLDAHFERLELGGGPMGVPYGYPAIDQYTNGMHKGMLIYVIGRPKRYKSWQLIKSFVAAQQAGKKAVLFTLEMGLQEMFNRYACMATGTSWYAFNRGDLMPGQRRALYEKLDELQEGPQATILRPPIDGRTVGDLCAVAQEYDPDILYIDQLKYIKSTQRVSADLRHREIEFINEELKEACEEFPIFLAAQFNREAAQLEEMADLSKIGLSDSIGQTADIIFGLHQSKEMKRSNILEFGIVEARSLNPCSWDLSVELTPRSDFRWICEK